MMNMVKKNNLAILGCLLVCSNAIANPPGGPKLDSQRKQNTSKDEYLEQAFKSFGEAMGVFGRAVTALGEALKPASSPRGDDREAHNVLRGLWVSDHGFFWRTEDVTKMSKLVSQINILSTTHTEDGVRTLLNDMLSKATSYESNYQSRLDSKEKRKNLGDLEDQSNDAEDLYKLSADVVKKTKKVYTNTLKITQAENFHKKFEDYKKEKDKVYNDEYQAFLV
jgi:hypothetical protein